MAWLLAMTCAVAIAQQTLDADYRITGREVLAAFEPQRQVLQTSSAVILQGRKEMGYGVVISPDGHILVKASDVESLKDIDVMIDQTRYKGAKLLAVDPAWDVGLLKIEASGLVPVRYARSSALPQGTWVVANGATSRTQRRALAGIISAKAREIPPSGGYVLGLMLDEKEVGKIQEVNEGMGAERAGLLKGDRLVKIGDQAIETIEQIEKLSEILQKQQKNSQVEVTVLRGKERQQAVVALSSRDEMASYEGNRNDQMSGEYSIRRSRFPRVIQHDILGNRYITGGPLLNLDGLCVGMNIARATRAESFAIPVEELPEIAKRLLASQP